MLSQYIYETVTVVAVVSTYSYFHHDDKVLYFNYYFNDIIMRNNTYELSAIIYYF